MRRWRVSKWRPIIMTGESSLAILADRKTQTRRVIKPQPKDDPSATMPWVDDGPSPSGAGRCGHSLSLSDCPYGVPGDRLWVRETWQYNPHGGIVYKAGSGIVDCDGRGWRPSIYMPKVASRLALEVVSVRVERVQQISGPDAIAEGLANIPGDPLHEPDGSVVEGLYRHYALYIERFRNLWDSLNAKRDGGAYAWDKNPWVWVIEFKRIEGGAE